MRFSTYNDEAEEKENDGEEEDKENTDKTTAGPSKSPSAAASNSSNLLILLVDPNDPNTEDPFDVLFEEAMRMVAQGENVHWFRQRPAREMPPVAKTLVMRPNHLSRIRFHYGYEQMFECIQQFLCRPIYVNFTACTALIVELYDSSVYLERVECATLMALLANTGNWLAKRRQKRPLVNRKQQFVNQMKPKSKTFPVILLLRDFAEYRPLISMYTRNGLAWRSRQSWEDIFGWKRKEEEEGKQQLEIVMEELALNK